MNLDFLWRNWAIILLIAALCTGAIVYLRNDGAGPHHDAQHTHNYRLAIASIVEIPPIVDLRRGFREVFETSQFSQNTHVNIEEYNANGDSSVAAQIVDQLASERPPPDLIYVLGTPLAQQIQKRLPNVLLVQGAVTDPVAAGLADSFAGSGRMYIATSDLPPMDRQLELLELLTPDAKRLGAIYNPGESNSIAVISRLREEVQKRRSVLTIVDGPVSTTADIPVVLDSMLGRVDALFLPPDNTAASAMAAIGSFAARQRLPLYATNRSVLEVGALGVVAVDFVELGRESAHLALKAIEGKDPRTLPIRFLPNPAMIVNKSVAERLGLDLEGVLHDKRVTAWTGR